MEAERTFRAKAERQITDLRQELNELESKLEECVEARAAQLELNKRREADVNRIKSELEENILQNEATVSALRQKHHEAVEEISGQVEALNKTRIK